MSGSTSELIETARRSAVASQRRTIISPDTPLPTRSFDKDGVVPRFELYHAPFSICSNKVRLILAELGQVWLSHEMDITAPAQENYRPDYVRLRLASDIAQTATLSTEFSGGSSVAESGFDALVVPTLVDNLEMKIVADSKNICLYLSRQVQNPNLLPADLEYEILGQVNAVDATPHVALLYGANPDGDRRPPVFQRGTVGVHDDKIAALERARSDAPDLAHAYNAKIAKERSAEKFVDDPQSMRSAIDQVDAQIEALNKSLGKTEGSWLFGSSYTLADAMWALSLFRLEYLGYGQMWREGPERVAVAHYADACYARPACETAVRHWPGSPPSQWVADLMP